jgi:hypothetical protein
MAEDLRVPAAGPFLPRLKRLPRGGVSAGLKADVNEAVLGCLSIAKFQKNSEFFHGCYGRRLPREEGRGCALVFQIFFDGRLVSLFQGLFALHHSIYREGIEKTYLGGRGAPSLVS